MDKFSYINNANGAYIEEQYQQYKKSPESVDDGWRKFFDGYEFALQASSFNGKVINGDTPVSIKEVNVVKLINAYRTRGHLIAKTNPIRDRRKHPVDLGLEYFDLTEEDLDREFHVGKEIDLNQSSLRQILDRLKKTYCSSIGVEFRQIRDAQIRQWMYKEIEPTNNDPGFNKEEKLHILDKLNHAVTFENFLHTKYVGKKRFSLEGGETVIPGIDALVEMGAELGSEEFIFGMAHRGRLNVLVNVFQKSYEAVFSEFEGTKMPHDVFGDGDVKYHLGRSADITTRKGKSVHLSLTANPSHLEAVNPVVQGIVRAKLARIYKKDYKKIIPILIHGDAAIAGQGINYEIANFSKMEGYQTGGTIHVVINNQVGFTANYKETRSSVYCTDIAKILEAPVFHVNGDDPEAVVHVMQMAIKLRQEFNIDVFVDILCYRRYGHNEGDEPKFTQPVLYDLIKKHDNVAKLYLNQLLENGVINKEEADKSTKEFKEILQNKLEFARQHSTEMNVNYLGRNWKGLRVAKEEDFIKSQETAFSRKLLDKIAKTITSVPNDFNLFSKMKRLLDSHKNLYFEQGKVDWGLAESIAFGSLLIENHHVRLSGQDSKRGTFLHRHSSILDTVTEKEYVPLNHIEKNQAPFTAYNSILSEYGVLGFEFGYSLAMPNSLVIWEAQFGDFANGAQIMFDQFISSSESKWQRMSGLVLLLPHGYEGQGPEHSSARLERYLQMCGQYNMVVCNVTSPANLFHLLRRQVKQEFRKPLIIMSPKSLLRHPEVISNIEELENGSFQEILYDPDVKPAQAKKVVMCSGKVYFDLKLKQRTEKIKDVAILRLEQLYPFVPESVKKLKQKYKTTKRWAWVQEESLNMGAWDYIHNRIPFIDFECVSRPVSASPATGSSETHDSQQAEIIKKAFE